MKRREFLGTVAAGMAVAATGGVDAHAKTAARSAAIRREVEKRALSHPASKYVYTIEGFLERLKWPQSHLASSLRTFGPRMKGRWLQQEAEAMVFDFCPDGEAITDWVDDRVYFTAIHDGVAYQSRWRMKDGKPASHKPRLLIFAPSDRYDEVQEAIAKKSELTPGSLG